MLTQTSRCTRNSYSRAQAQPGKSEELWYNGAFAGFTLKQANDWGKFDVECTFSADLLEDLLQLPEHKARTQGRNTSPLSAGSLVGLHTGCCKSQGFCSCEYRVERVSISVSTGKDVGF